MPRKRFGQHFLRDPMIIQRIIAALALNPYDHFVEIGPGEGALTFPVLKQVNHLDAVELDRDLIPVLRTKGHDKLSIHEADALTFDFANLKTDARPLYIFGNLPYNISTPLIFHLFDYASIVNDMLFMLQKEVALRLAATPHSKDYGRLSVMAQYHCQMTLLFDVPPSAFYPPPRVQSSIIRMTPYAKRPHQAIDETLFASIVQHAFGQRRKTLRNSLKEIIHDDTWAHIDIHSDLRAENLSVEQFVAISNAVSNHL